MEHEIEVKTTPQSLINDLKKVVEEKSAGWEAKAEQISKEFDVKFEAKNQELTQKLINSQKESDEIKSRMDFMEAELKRGGNSKEDNSRLKTELKELENFWSRKDFDKKYLRTDSLAQGGVFIPEVLKTDIIKSVSEISPVRQIARVWSTTDKQVKFSVRKTKASASKTGEGISASDSNSTYGSELLTAYKYTGVTIYTLEMLTQSILNVGEQIKSDLMEDLAERESADFVNGSGLDGAEGFMKSGVITQELNSGDANKLTPASLVQLTGEIKTSGYNPVYGFNRKTLAAIQSFVGLGNDHFIFTGLETGKPFTIAGYNYVLMPEMENIGANKYPVVFGDFTKGYYILDNTNIYSTVDEYTLASEGKIRIVLHKFTGGKVVQPEAFAKIKIST